MRNDLLDAYFDLKLSFQQERELMVKHLLQDLKNYNFNTKEWDIEFSDVTDEGHEFSLSNIGIINKKTKKLFGGGWSDYIATSNGKELYIFWDILEGRKGEAKKNGIIEKNIFGVPPHIQKKFSDKLKQEIIDEKHCGEDLFLKSSYLEDVIKKLLQKKGEYYSSAQHFLKETREHVPYEERLAKYEAYSAVNEYMKEGGWKKMFLEEILFEYYVNLEGTKFIKYDRQGGDFLIINNNKEIDEYWKFPPEEFDEYIKENKLIKITEEEFNNRFLS